MEAPMKDNDNRGYTKEEYYQISAKHGLPKRCPILRNCCRAIETRYYMGFRIGNNIYTFEDFLESQNQRWEPDTMITSIEQITWSYAPDVLMSIQNVCPEVTLFEGEYLPFKFRQAAFGEASYYKETRRFEATAKHYSECAEYSEYSFQKGMTKTSQKKRKRSNISNGKRFEIFQRDGFRCYYCKKHFGELPNDKLPKGLHLEIDHKIPQSAGGDDSYDNLVTACSVCNSGKSDKRFKDL